MEFGRRIRGGIGVCFFVVMVREMIEGLESVAGIGMEMDSIFASACDVLESVERGFVVLLTWYIFMRCQKGEDKSCIWAIACGQPINEANNTLLSAYAAFEVLVLSINRWNGINGKAEEIGGHIWTYSF